MQICRGILSVAVLSVLLAAPAQANVKPKILIIFDTSGSMLASNADGSQLCGGTGSNSRIYKLKTALFDVLQGMGATEVDFALQTFPMKVDPTRTPKCSNTCTDASTGYNCSGHYYVVAGQNSEISGWSSRHGCKISTHTPTTQTNGNCGAQQQPLRGLVPRPQKGGASRSPSPGRPPRRSCGTSTRRRTPTRSRRCKTPRSVLRAHGTRRWARACFTPTATSTRRWRSPPATTASLASGWWWRCSPTAPRPATPAPPTPSTRPSGPPTSTTT